MLVEIWSPAFKANGEVRERIQFRRGLNVIKGADDGTNSIGKSSLLLAIDFVFGGATYLDSEAPKEIGAHTIYWSMEFDDGRYFFGRNIANPKQVIICDEDYSHTGKTIPLDHYGNRLAERYGLDLETVSWRQLRTSFFRIYGKDNFDEKNPLRGWPGQSKESALKTLLDLFGYYQTLAPYDQRRTDTKEAFQAFRTAQQYKFLPDTSGGSKALARQRERMSTLESKREAAINQSDAPVSNDEVADEQERLELRRQINKRERKISVLDRRIQMVRMTEKYGVRIDPGDLLALQKLFPGVDLRPMHEIERFHVQLAELLESNAASEREELEEQRAQLVQERDGFKAQLNDLGVGPGYSREFLDHLREIDEELGELRTKTEAHEQYQALEQAKQRAAQAYDNAVERFLTQLQDDINQAMEEISHRIAGPDFNPPVLAIKGYNSFTFETPHDGGTGTGCRGLIIYDFAMLQISDLPVLAHDTNILKQCDDQAVEGIMEEYGASQKQIFLAFDRADRYTPRVNAIADKHTVITLGPDGRTLYGHAWNKKAAQ